MAKLINKAVIIIMAVIKAMEPRLPPRIRAEFHAEDLVAQLFRERGWKVQKALSSGPYEPDFLLKKGRHQFIVEVKAAAEGRVDRVIPMLAHAVIQAQAYAREHQRGQPLAIVFVRHASSSLLKHVEGFAQHLSGGVAIGLIADDGLRRFYGGGLDELNADSAVKQSQHAAVRPRLFSDLNQWMLKVLLAPEIPEHLLDAPRNRYRNASELAKASQVSVMSAFRCHQQLRDEEFIDESSGYLRLVRRPELFRRWQAEALRSPSREIAMNFLLRGNRQHQLRQLIENQEACLGLFAAADALKLGHVSGVPPYVYVRKPSEFWQRHSDELFPAAEKPDVIVRQAPAPESIFRGMVGKDDIAFADVIQVWLDVSAHSSRGEEQAALIYRKILKPVIEVSGP
jgi:hypothetical protein